MASSGPSIAQLFYNVGQGFNEKDSASLRLASHSLNSFEHLSFALPDKTVRGLRFDPLTNEGRVVIRRLEIRNFNVPVKIFTVSQVTPLHQIANRTELGNAVEFATTSGANDPGVNVLLPKPIRFRWMLSGHDFACLGVINGSLLGVFFLLLKRCKINRRFEFMAKQLSRSGFLKLDASAIWIYAGLVIFFCLACLLDLNGSSAGMYRTYGNGPESELWLGSPQPVRADEWAYVTPDILNQYFRANRFALEDSVLGNHNIALTGNVPVKHLSTLFRPQFWPFFVLPAGYAYSVYWQTKALVLVAGIFTFLLWISRSSGWALIGALWYFFSPFTQWSYSWPSALPEMVGSLCVCVVCFCYLTVGRSSRWLAPSAIGTAISAVSFVMCAYPPHLIPLAWLGFAIVAAWCVTRRAEILSTKALWVRLVAIALAGALLAGVGLNVYSDLKPAIAAVADTVYPGRRLLPGGTLPVWKLASHFLPWTETGTHFPQMLGNMSEGSGFLWLAPVTLFCLPRLTLSTFQKAALIAFWICFLALFVWCAFPVPSFFGRITGLDRCTGARCLPALGLANVGIVALTMAGLKSAQRKYQLAFLLIGWAAFLSVLWAANQHLGVFFSPLEIVLAALFLGLLSMLLVTARARALALCLLIPQALVFGWVNPIERGLGEFTQSDFNRFVQGHRELLNGKWLVYSDMPIRSGFVAEAGCQVYTGTRYIPDIDHFPLFAARGLDLNTFNRLGYLDAHAISRDQPTRFVQRGPVIVEWDVAPTDPLLAQLDIRYVAFDSKPDAKLSDGLTAVSEEPIDGFWIYRATPVTASASSSPPR
jgi:hypothetical protein